MCCFWDCCTSDCYLHGLVLQAIWQFSRGHLALSKKGDSHHDDVYFPWVRWNWGLFPHGLHRVLLLIAFFRFQLFLLRVILFLKVRRGFLHACWWAYHQYWFGTILEIVFCLLRSWCHKVILLFASPPVYWFRSKFYQTLDFLGLQLNIRMRFTQVDQH